MISNTVEKAALKGATVLVEAGAGPLGIELSDSQCENAPVVKKLDTQVAARRMQSKVRMLQTRRLYLCSLANAHVVSISI